VPRLALTNDTDPNLVCRLQATRLITCWTNGTTKEDASLMVNATPHHSYHKGYGVTAVTSGHGTKGMSDGRHSRDHKKYFIIFSAR